MPKIAHSAGPRALLHAGPVGGMQFIQAEFNRFQTSHFKCTDIFFGFLRVSPLYRPRTGSCKPRRTSQMSSGDPVCSRGRPASRLPR